MDIVSLDLNEIPRVFFWDVDIESLNLERDYFFIISRVLSFTTEESLRNNMNVLTTQFEVSVILDVLKHTDEIISDVVCRLISEYYNVPNYSKFGTLTA